MSAEPFAPYFLGACGENNELFERVLVELLRDHVYWRRNFHPEDLPPIGTQELHAPEYLDGVARTRQELHSLTAALKRSVPFFHPRYLGHMVSDLLMPGLIAELVTTLYNPNNVVEDVAPVTVELELEVGRQLARMIGFACAEGTDPHAFGHLTSGGTLANDEALWLARAAKLFPLAVKDAVVESGLSPDLGIDLDVDDFELLNLPLEDVARVIVDLSGASVVEAKSGPGVGGGALDPRDRERLWRLVTRHRAETLGLARFAARHPIIQDLAVLAPGTAHYSLQKALKLLGLGTDALVELPTLQARIDPQALRDRLEDRRRSRRPVLAVLGVYGTTEFGTFDPIDELVLARSIGLSFWLHVDAAWGGYIPSLFRTPEGALRERGDILARLKYFPSERVYRATEALAAADSITVDPHKLGFVPYGAGAVVVRDRRFIDLLQQDSPYLFHRERELHTDRFRRLGRFILEGSKPGAAAAACYVNHRVLPLHGEAFGRLIERSVHTCELLYDRIGELSIELAPLVRVAIPFEPDCNLLCLAVNPRGNRSLREANAFGHRLFDAMAVKADRPVQLRDFFGSCTTVGLHHLGRSELERIGNLLDLELLNADDSGLFLLRHTLMNPWLQASPKRDGHTYLEAYADFLKGLVRDTLASRS